MIHRYKILQKLVDLLLPGYTIVYPAYEQMVIHVSKRVVSSGSGPEIVVGGISDNPNWHYNKAANAVAVAKWLEKNGA